MSDTTNTAAIMPTVAPLSSAKNALNIPILVPDDASPLIDLEDIAAIWSATDIAREGFSPLLVVTTAARAVLVAWLKIFVFKPVYAPKPL